MWVIDLIETTARVPEEYLKHIEDTDGLYEIRVHFGRIALRFFCFFDKGKLVVAMNGFQKKTAKTPKKEIDLALKIKNDYETEKYNNI